MLASLLRGGVDHCVRAIHSSLRLIIMTTLTNNSPYAQAAYVCAHGLKVTIRFIGLFLLKIFLIRFFYRVPFVVCHASSINHDLR